MSWFEISQSLGTKCKIWGLLSRNYCNMLGLVQRMLGLMYEQWCGDAVMQLHVCMFGC
jgi:hypothetical protein